MPLTTTDGSKTQYSFLAETVPGTPIAGVYQALRCKAGAKFDLNRNTFASQDLRSDRMESSLSYGVKSGQFSLPVEYSYGTYDAFLEALLGGSWTTNVLKVGNTTRTFAFEENATDIGIVERICGAQIGEISIGQKTDAIAEGSIGGMFRNTRIAQTKGVNLAYDSAAKTITRATDGFTTVDGWAVGDPVTALGNADSGNNNTTPWIITSLTDTVMTFTTATGIVTKASAAGIVLNMGTLATSTTAVGTTAPFDSFTGSVTEGGSVVAHVTGWDLKMTQDLNPNFSIGSDSAQSVSSGIFKVSGNINVYYIDQALRKKFVNGVGTTLNLVLGSVAATKAYTFAMNSVKFTSNTRDNSPLARVETMGFTATYNSGDSSSIVITRTP